MSMPEALDGLPRRVADWAVGRSLAPNSMAGISLALGLCAAAWFSAGTRPDNISGALALFASYLAWRAARWLAGPAASAAGGAGPGTLAELCGAVSDCAVYAGLAVGGYEAHWSGTWELAAAVVIAVAVRTTAVACGGHVAGDGEGNPLGSAVRRLTLRSTRATIFTTSMSVEPRSRTRAVARPKLKRAGFCLISIIYITCPWPRLGRMSLGGCSRTERIPSAR